MTGKSMTKVVGEGMVWLTAGNFAVKVVGLVYTVLVISQLTVKEYGLVALALSIPAMLGIFNLAGTQPVIIADLVALKARGDVTRMRHLISSYFSLRMIASSLAGILLFLSSLIFSESFFKETIWLVQILALTFFISPVRSLIVIFQNVANDFKGIAIYKLVEDLFKLSLVGVLLLFFKLGPLGVIVSYAVTEYVVTLAFLFVIWKFKSNHTEGILFSAGIRDPLHFTKGHAKWSLFHGGINTFSKQVRLWFVQLFLGTTAVGIFAAALGLLQNTGSLVSFSKVIGPIVPRFVDDKPSVTKLLNVAIKYQIVAQILVSLGVIAVLPFIISTFFPDYFESYFLLLMMIIVLIPEGISDLYETVFHAFQKQKSLLTASVTKLISTVVFLPLGLFLFGIPGVALEMLITQILYLLGRYKVLKSIVAGYEFTLATLIRFSDTDRLIIKAIKSKLGRFLGIFKKSW